MSTSGEVKTYSIAHRDASMLEQKYFLLSVMAVKRYVLVMTF